MTRLWHHPPETLRALLATFKAQYVVCHPCRRWMPLRVQAKDLDRRCEPCPFRCDLCKRRGEIVFDVPDGFSPVGPELGPPVHRSSF